MGQDRIVVWWRWWDEPAPPNCLQLYDIINYY